MFRRLFRNAARKFGARYDYDVGYMEDLAELSPGGFAKLALLTPFTQERFGVPAAPYYAAKFIAARTAGCGPCAMLVVRMAEEAGVSAQQLASIARPGSADADMRLAADYATAVLANSFDLADMIETAASGKKASGACFSRRRRPILPHLKAGRRRGAELRPAAG
ncbi:MULTISPECIES: hypothetical protein [Rhizobium]|uniref:hypothetical protein n=1 Tax=Rhizobium TaxID=379 RepID=UPI000BE8398D|nr:MULTISPECIES: hypothetical protein [Rhizobium]MBY4590049.1 hypothetical protein [Rhizobium redzepovicii]PDS81621.1 hypothetical protein CO654_29585 [Rhizobium sp. L18]ULJ82325.1 hypothetical protein MF410_30000 [Rhizobium sp. C104]